jgi:hypothetical protein
LRTDWIEQRGRDASAAAGDRAGAYVDAVLKAFARSALLVE